MPGHAAEVLWVPPVITGCPRPPARPAPASCKQDVGLGPRGPVQRPGSGGAVCRVPVAEAQALLRTWACSRGWKCFVMETLVFEHILLFLREGLLPFWLKKCWAQLSSESSGVYNLYKNKRVLLL